MRLALNTRVLQHIQHQGPVLGLRFVSEHKTDTILEGEPIEFEALYDRLNGASNTFAAQARRVREGIDRKAP